MGNGTSAAQRKLCNSKTVFKYSKAYNDVMAKVRATTDGNRVNNRQKEGYEYVPGDKVLESGIVSNCAYGTSDGDHAVMLTDSETPFFSDGGNHIKVSSSDKKIAVWRLRLKVGYMLRWMDEKKIMQQEKSSITDLVV